jgi:hypothetical protein
MHISPCSGDFVSSSPHLAHHHLHS